jgi:hypothetical protein
LSVRLFAGLLCLSTATAVGIVYVAFTTPAVAYMLLATAALAAVAFGLLAAYQAAWRRGYFGGRFAGYAGTGSLGGGDWGGDGSDSGGWSDGGGSGCGGGGCGGGS